MSIVFDTFYLHYHKNIDRYQYLEKYINGSLPGELVTCFDKGKFNPTDYYNYSYKENFIAINSIAHILDYNMQLINKLKSDTKHISTINMNNPSNYKSYFIRQLTPKQISLTNLSLNLKHRYCWASILDSNAEFGLVLEDDIIFKDTSIDQLFTLLKNIDLKYFDYIDLGGGCMLKPDGLNFSQFNDTNIYYLKVPSTRTTCAYLISKDFASPLISNQPKIMFPIDFQLTYCFNIFQSKVGWIDPEIFIHGSEHGYYNSSNPKL